MILFLKYIMRWSSNSMIRVMIIVSESSSLFILENVFQIFYSVLISSRSQRPNQGLDKSFLHRIMTKESDTVLKLADDRFQHSSDKHFYIAWSIARSIRKRYPRNFRLYFFLTNQYIVTDCKKLYKWFTHVPITMFAQWPGTVASHLTFGEDFCTKITATWHWEATASSVL